MTFSRTLLLRYGKAWKILERKVNFIPGFTESPPTKVFLTQQKKKASISIDQEDQVLVNKLKSDSNFDANKLEWKLQLAIQSLPEKQKAVFNLRYYDEMPYEEMSRVLETSVGALKASYHHAAKKIEDYILNH